ncbi:hypothetical protein Ndes2437B_g08352 [Nannochloris sp. 'desiccata']
MKSLYIFALVVMGGHFSLTSANYKAFAELMEKYGDRGFTIQAFPCNQFGFQEPGTNEEIKAFAAARGFTGILMDKINVNGKNASPVFDFLKVGANDTSLIGWNFAKFLVRKDGSVAGRFSPKTNPMELETQIEELLKQE